MVEQRVTLAAACMLAEHDKPVNMKKIVGFIKEAAEEEAQLLVLPECALQGFLWSWDWEKHVFREDEEQNQYFHKEAEPVPGPSTEIIAKYAARHNMVIQLGMVERADEGGVTLLYNSAAVVGPEGLIGVFRKVHSLDKPIHQGTRREFLVFDTSVGKIGPIICYDLAFPESVRVLALKGAEIITMSTAWGMDPTTGSAGYRYDLLGRANALMNGLWMVISDLVGAPKRSTPRDFGHSRIIDPQGNIVAGIGYEEGLVTARVNVRAGIRPNRFAERHPECYRII